MIICEEFVSPLQGLLTLKLYSPKALPWAIIFCPFRAYRLYGCFRPKALLPKYLEVYVSSLQGFRAEIYDAQGDALGYFVCAFQAGR